MSIKLSSIVKNKVLRLIYNYNKANQCARKYIFDAKKYEKISADSIIEFLEKIY